MKEKLMKVWRRHGALIPLYVCVSVGFSGAIAFALRNALYNPDVQWNRSTERIPNEEFRNKQFKLYTPKVDSVKIDCQAPIYEEIL